MLVLKYSDSSILLFLTPAYPTAVLFGVQNRGTIQRIVILQKKAVRITNFQLRNFHTSPLFKENFILKFLDKICLENILFFSKSLNNLTLSVFSTFSFSSDQHNYVTSNSRQGNLTKLLKQINMGSIQSL